VDLLQKPTFNLFPTTSANLIHLILKNNNLPFSVLPENFFIGHFVLQYTAKLKCNLLNVFSVVLD